MRASSRISLRKSSASAVRYCCSTATAPAAVDTIFAPTNWNERASVEGTAPGADEVKGSYAGAMGWPQFMPGSWNRYGVDFDGDGRADLIGSPLFDLPS